jgi:hypothetical protein
MGSAGLAGEGAQGRSPACLPPRRLEERGCLGILFLLQALRAYNGWASKAKIENRAKTGDAVVVTKYKQPAIFLLLTCISSRDSLILIHMEAKTAPYRIVKIRKTD